MQLQRGLAALPSVGDAGVIMGTPANKELLAQGNLLTPEAEAAGPEDLVIVIRADTQAVADDALARVDALLTRKRSAEASASFRPKSLETAAAMLPWRKRRCAWARMSFCTATT
jgi:FdrA protein